MGSLAEQIKAVIEAREAAKVASEAKKESLDKWMSDNAPLILEETATLEAAGKEESLLREIALEVYAETGDKAPAPGVGIREMVRLVYDGKIAFDWAKAHKIALKLDAKAFEKIAKASPLDFVQTSTEAVATISPNLAVTEK